VTSASAYALSGQAITFAGLTPQLNTSGAAHSIANPITLSAALALTNGSQLTLSGAVGAAAGLTKSGAGTLLVTGTIAGPVTVSAGTLGGTGTIAGAVTVQGGATLAPGLSPGVINTGDLNLAGVALIEIEGTALGTQYDNINVTGTVTIAGATLTVAGAHVPAPGSTFTIITNDGADPVVGTFAGLAEGATVTVNGKPLTISYVGGTGNDVVLAAPAPAAQAIPTLSQWALLLLAALVAACGAAFARRRQTTGTRGEPLI
jgi:autotransporter-associated beta strand protein